MECKPTELQQQRRWNHHWRASVVDFFLASPTVGNSSKSRPFGRGRNDVCQTHSTSGETPSQITIYVCCEEGEKYTRNSAFEFLYQWHQPQCFTCRSLFAPCQYKQPYEKLASRGASKNPRRKLPFAFDDSLQRLREFEIVLED
eukprot:scaffold6012_cov127-Cylindrotheca_fusiformis.AAC.1